MSKKSSTFVADFAKSLFGVPDATCKVVVGRAEAQVARLFSGAV